MERSIPLTIEESRAMEIKVQRRRRAVIGAAVVASAFLAAPVVDATANAVKPLIGGVLEQMPRPQGYSAEDFEGKYRLVAGEGRGLQSYIDEHVENAGAMNDYEGRSYVQRMPENIPTFEDGKLGAGEPLILPEKFIEH